MFGIQKVLHRVSNFFVFEDVYRFFCFDSLDAQHTCVLRRSDLHQSFSPISNSKLFLHSILNSQKRDLYLFCVFNWGGGLPAGFSVTQTPFFPSFPPVARFRMFAAQERQKNTPKAKRGLRAVPGTSFFCGKFPISPFPFSIFHFLSWRKPCERDF